ncbi:hypothetical protein ACFL6U_29425, partial [Planctomycetota bacterium]
MPDDKQLPQNDPPSDTLWPRMTKEEINGCPMHQYEGRIRVIQSSEELARVVAQLEKETILGFDTETRPTFRSGQSYPPAVLQLAGTHEVYIYQLLKRRFPKSLRNILANPNIAKAGAGLDR